MSCPKETPLHSSIYPWKCYVSIIITVSVVSIFVYDISCQLSAIDKDYFKHLLWFFILVAKRKQLIWQRRLWRSILNWQICCSFFFVSNCSHIFLIKNITRFPFFFQRNHFCLPLSHRKNRILFMCNLSKKWKFESCMKCYREGMYLLMCGTIYYLDHWITWRDLVPTASNFAIEKRVSAW